MGQKQTSDNCFKNECNIIARRDYLRIAGFAGTNALCLSTNSGRVRAASNLPHTLTVAANGPYSSYTFTVSGDLGAKEGIAGKDEISGSTATGAVSGSGRDSYAFSGVISNLNVQGNATVYLNGDSLDTSLEHTLVVEATGSYSKYTFSATGNVSARQGIAGKDSISGSTATGAVGGDGLDSYGFSGELETIDVEGAANVYIDGELVGSNLENTITVEATGSYSSYSISVSGDLEAKAGIAGKDRIDGSTATGAVGGGGRDSYGFSGTIVDLDVDGSANVYLNGDPLDTSLEHTLVVEATDSYSSYKFSVSGDISARQGIAGKDRIDGSTASGAVSSRGQDAYGFSGKLTNLKVRGDATVYKDDEPATVDNDTRLVGHWPMRAISRGMTPDVVNGNDMMLAGSPNTVDSGPFGHGIHIQTSSGEYGKIPHASMFDPDSDFTWTGWVRLLGLTNPGDTILHKRGQYASDTAANYGLSVNTKDQYGPGHGSMSSFFGDGNSLYTDSTPGNVPEGPLIHFALTFKAAENRFAIWINGERQTTETFSAEPTSTSVPIWVGIKYYRDGTIGNETDMILSDLRFYNYALEGRKIRSLYKLPYPDSPSFRAYRSGRVLGDDWYDPVVRYDSSYRRPYRLLAYNLSQRGVSFLTSLDGHSWTVDASDVMTGVEKQVTAQDFVKIDGTYYVYGSVNDTTTHVWSGESFGSLTYESQIVPEGDCGVYYDGRYTHIYTEDSTFKYRVGSDKMSHWRSETPTGSFTDVGIAVDVTDVPWHTGDPHVLRVNDHYWMFADNTSNHPHYGTALFRSSDLYEWELIREDINSYQTGGDLVVFETPEGLRGMTEYSGLDTAGIDIYEVRETDL